MADVNFKLNETAFVWDSEKEKANIRNHDGISFRLAATAFFDPFLKLIDASRNDETRDAIVGFDKKGRLLFVVHMELEEEAIRIISARQATSSERDFYDS